jgi:hypothetical protein
MREGETKEKTAEGTVLTWREISAIEIGMTTGWIDKRDGTERPNGERLLIKIKEQMKLKNERNCFSPSSAIKVSL